MEIGLRRRSVKSGSRIMAFIFLIGAGMILFADFSIRPIRRCHAANLAPLAFLGFISQTYPRAANVFSIVSRETLLVPILDSIFAIRD
jgi:hypothetical protein